MINSIFDWNQDKQPVATVLDIIVKVGPVAIPHLKAALKKKTPYKKVLEQAIARLEKS